MTEHASDELIAMAESMAELAKAGGASGYAVAGMFERLISRIRQQDETIKRMDEALHLIERLADTSSNHEIARTARAARKEPT